MHKLLLSAAIALAALPLGARAATTATLTEYAFVNLHYSDPTTYIGGEAWIESTTSAIPSTDPGSLLPPTSLIEPNQIMRGSLNGCVQRDDGYGNPTQYCFSGSFEQPLSPGELTFDGVPLPGNAMTLTTAVQIEGPFGPMAVTLDGSFAKPRNTSFNQCAQCAGVNPWLHDGTTHVDVSSFYAPILRSGYDGVVKLTAPDVLAGTVPATAGLYYHMASSAQAGAEA